MAASANHSRASSRITFHGHRRRSFAPADNAEMVELRARQRTFDGAYARSAIGCLAYALTFLKLFDSRFYKIGLTFLALSVMLAIIAAIRQRHTYIDFSDQFRPPTVPGGPRIFGRPFVTAGQIVIAVTIVVAAVEIALLVLVLRMTDSVAAKVSGLGHVQDLVIQPT